MESSKVNKQTKTRILKIESLRFRRSVMRNTIYYSKNNDYRVHWKRSKDIDLIN